MGYYYEFINPDADLPVKAIIHAVNEISVHWHKQIEIIMVLDGTVNIRSGKEKHLLKTGDIAFINSNEVHNTSTTGEPNLLLAVQIDPEFYKGMYPNFTDLYIDCNAILLKEPNEDIKNIIRRYLAQIVWEMTTQKVGYRSKIGSILYLLTGELFAISPFYQKEDMAISSDDDLNRLQRITEYIDMNLHKKVTLKEIAEIEHLSYYYVSHFIKEKLGMTFQEYLNQTRLSKALSLLLYSDKNVVEISSELGFKNLAAFNKIFKQEFNVTPSEFQELAFHQHLTQKPNEPELILKQTENINIFPNNEDDTPKVSRTYLDVDRTNALKTLFSYLDTEEIDIKEVSTIEKEVVDITVNANEVGQELEPYWRKLTTFTRAAEGLRQEWQIQLHELQREISFEYIRFHGIFSDDMMIYQTSLNGEVSYNWTYVDSLIDKLLENGIRPFVELGFMPSDLKSTNQTVFWWRANISPPNDIEKWQDLVTAFIRHCINRYSLKEVETWYFEVWNEPELEHYFWAGSKTDYFAFYEATVLAIKEISPQIKVGGPAIAHQAVKDSSWLEDFLIYCNEGGVPLDFVSLHIYPEKFPEVEDNDELTQQFMSTNIPFEKKAEQLGNMPRIYYGADNTYESIISARTKIKDILGYLPKLCITEWNASAYHRNLIHDTAYVATYIIHNVVKCIGLVDMLGYWTFTDINEEIPLGVPHFHGNFGLMNKDGIKKPSYFAYYLLAKLGDTILATGDNYIITKNDNSVQVLLYNFAYFNDLFLTGDTSLLSHTNRYQVYENKLTQDIKLTIEGLEGNYKITRYKLNRQHGSAYDKWVEMGAVEEMTAEEINYLKNNSYPKMQVEYVELLGAYQANIILPVHGVELVEIRKVY